MLLRDETKFVLRFQKPGHDWQDLTGSQRDTREESQKVYAQAVNGYPPSYRWRMVRCRTAEEVILQHPVA